MKLIRNLYLTTKFFIALMAVAVLFTLSFPLPFLMFLAVACLLVLSALLVLDIYLLFKVKNPVHAHRKHAKTLSLGDENEVRIELENRCNFKINIAIIDELPEQLQVRDFAIKAMLDAFKKRLTVNYHIQPKSRGIYSFQNINLFISSPLGIIERRLIIEAYEDVPVYPSIIQMKNFELKALTSISHFPGVKKIRRIGHSYEFEQIKQYIPGDDTRSINWSASSRTSELMVNQYQDERSQPVYCIIDKGRTMRMPFNGLSLLDYAINTSLVISNIVLRKYDKAGLLTFSNKLGSYVKAEKHTQQLNKIIQNLYQEKVNWLESDYELLYSSVSNFIRGRSLLFIFTNFESVYALERILPLLRKLNKMHLLVVMYFDNVELKSFSEQACADLLSIHQQTAAKELIAQKLQIRQVLKMHGIQSFKTTPDNLSLDTVNKYLELKSRGYI